MKFSSLSALLISVLATYNPNDCYCVMNPRVNFGTPVLAFKDSDGQQFINMTLNARPCSSQQYHIYAPDSLFDKCVVSFDPSNWDQPQRVKMAPFLHLGEDKKFEFDLTAQSIGGFGTYTLPVIRSAETVGRAKSSGDPHVYGFNHDGRYNRMDFHPQNLKTVFYLFKSRPFEIQVYQDSCRNNGRAPACNKAFAIRWGRALYTYETRGLRAPKVTVDGEFEHGFYYSPPCPGRKSHIFYLPDRSKIVIDYHRSHNTIHLLLSPTIGSYGSGLFNRPSAEGQNLIFPDGKIGNWKNHQDRIDFVKAWKVPHNKNYFNGCPVDGNPVDLPDYKYCGLTPGIMEIPDNQWAQLFEARTPQPELLKRSNEEQDDTSVLPAVDDLPDDIDIRAKCTKLFEGTSQCHSLEDVEPYIDLCVADGVLEIEDGHFDLDEMLAEGQSQLEDYLAVCSELSRDLLKDELVSDKDEAARIAISHYGFGNNSSSCPNNCSDVGECTENGCVCQGSFKYDCSADKQYFLSSTTSARQRTNS